jgi:hypothetical protein
MKKITLFFLLELLTLVCVVSGEKIMWGENVDGLSVGISVAGSTNDSSSFPSINFYLRNVCNKPIEGVIQNGSRCILEVNGKYYAETDLGGKSSFMPPRKKYGPIQINPKNLRQIPQLVITPIINPKEMSPVLQKGVNKICVHYLLRSKRVQSGQIIIKRN